MTPAQNHAPPGALACPRCSAPATPSPVPQRCGRCGGSFTLRAGARLDPAVIPIAFDPRLPRIVVRSSGAILRSMGMVAPEGVSEGTLDPVTGYIPMDQQGVLYGDVFTIAVWRRLDWIRLVVAAILPIPISVFFIYLAVVSGAWALVGAAPFVGISAYMIWRGVGLKANMVRVFGGLRMITIRFDAPMWRRRRFHDELLYRAGISPSAIP